MKDGILYTLVAIAFIWFVVNFTQKEVDTDRKIEQEMSTTHQADKAQFDIDFERDTAAITGRPVRQERIAEAEKRKEAAENKLAGIGDEELSDDEWLKKHGTSAN